MLCKGAPKICVPYVSHKSNNQRALIIAVSKTVTDVLAHNQLANLIQFCEWKPIGQDNRKLCKNISGLYRGKA